jgi:two-component system, chemotaxis family, chemotaxis protein CheY
LPRESDRENNFAEVPMQNSIIKKILTVDDDEEIRNALSSLLELEGFESVWAKNGQVALEYLKRVPDSELPDLILLDYMMPVMNGAVFHEGLKNDPRLADIPVVMMTANGNLVSVMEKVEDAGAFMSKPMDYDTVVNMVKHFLGNQPSATPAF